MMSNRLLFISFLLINSTINVGAQSRDMWQTLGMVTFASSFDPSTYVEIKIPKVSAAVDKVDGTEITIDGYIIPLTGQVSQSHFMLSKFPQSTCFFCGKAGPETAMQVFMMDNKKIKITERKIKIKGTLSVNPKDASSLLYTLSDATILQDNQ